MDTSCQKCITMTPPQGLSVQPLKKSPQRDDLFEQYSKLPDSELMKIENAALKVMVATTQAQLAIKEIQKPAYCGNAFDCKA